MADRETLRIVVEEGLTKPLPSVVPRDADLARIEGRASVVIGPRRCGKTYRMYQQAELLMKNGVDRAQMLFVDFEDDRLHPHEGRLISDVVDELFAALSRRARSFDRLYLFFDEVQNVEDWGRQVRRLLGDGRFEVYVSGSSAKMLSKEIATEFKGRGISTEMFPLSFREYLRFHGEEGLALQVTSENRAVLCEEFRSYLRIGGFPEIQNATDQARILAQQGLVDVVIARDICARHNLPILGVEAFVKQALRTSGREFSVSKAYNTLKSRHVPLSRDAAYALPDHCEDAYLFFTISQLSRSYRVRKQGTRKLYSVDPGLQFAVSPASVDDEGQRFEDAVFMQMRRALAGSREGSISTFRTSTGREVDFVVGDAATESAFRLVQAAVEVDTPDKAKREYGALTDALDETGLASGEVVTLDATKCIPPDDSRIRVVSAWEWFL